MNQIELAAWDVRVADRIDLHSTGIAEDVDVILLDLLDKQSTGNEIEHEIKIIKNDFILKTIPMVTLIKGEAINRIQAIKGIDEVAVYPCDPMEISLRLTFALRGNKDDSEQILRIGELVINPLSYEVTINKKVVPLTYKEFELLRFLADNSGKACSRHVLVDKIWADRPNGTRTVDVHIRRLRSKLGVYGNLIATVRNVGYRFNFQISQYFSG